MTEPEREARRAEERLGPVFACHKYGAHVSFTRILTKHKPLATVRAGARAQGVLPLGSSCAVLEERIAIVVETKCHEKNRRGRRQPGLGSPEARES